MARRPRTGQVEINSGGYKQSGHGRQLGVYGLEEFLQTKAMHLPRGMTAAPTAPVAAISCDHSGTV